MAGESIDLLRTKLHRPAPAPDAVARPRVMAILDRGVAGILTLVTAPAGYGKSTAVSQWIENRETPTAWLSLEEGDNDLRQFLRYLLAAIRTASPEACPAIDALLLAEPLPSGEELATRLVNELLDLESRILLVLDDYHVIREPEIHTFLAAPLARPLPTLHLVVVSRRDPPLPLRPLRAAGQLNEVRMDGLRFTGQEARRFVEGASAGAMKEEAGSVVENMEGWPVGLRLLALRLRDAPEQDDLLARLPTVGLEVRDYLFGETLARIDSAQREMLLRIALLPRFCEGLCEAVGNGDDGDGAEFLAWLSQSGLFVIALDGAGEWFRFHHLFRDVLLNAARTELSEKDLRAVRHRAGIWLGRRNLIEEALDHLLEVDPEAAGNLVVEAHVAADSEMHENPLVTQRWLQRLPTEVIEASPGLSCLAGNADFANGRLSRARAAVERSLDLLKSAEIDPDQARRWRGRCCTLLAMIASTRRAHEEVVAFGREALELLPATDPRNRAEAYMILSVGLHSLGRSDESCRLLRTARAEFEDRPASLWSIRSGECFVELGRCNLWRYKAESISLSGYCDEHGLATAGVMARSFATQATYQLNELEEARHWSGEREKDREVAEARFYIAHRFQEVQTLRALGEDQGAEKVLRGLERFVERQVSRSFVDQVQAMRALIAFQDGQPGKATAWAENFQPEKHWVNWFSLSPSLLCARILLAQGDQDLLARARKILEETLETATMANQAASRAEILVLQALWCERLGEGEEAHAHLREALEVAVGGGLLRVFVDIGPELAPLLQRLRLDQEGTRFVGRILAAMQVGRATPGASPPSSSPLVESLTPREFEILELLAQRYSNKDIAERLRISPHTVKRHSATIYGKLGVHGREAAAAKAVGLGLLKA